MHPNLNSAGSDAEYIDKLSEWQRVLREYERISGKELDQTVKTVTLMEDSPPQLRLRSEGIVTDHKKVILAIEGYVRRRRKLGILEARLTCTLVQSTRAKGKGQIKGKGKEKTQERKNNENSKSDRKCFVSGKLGHFAKDCDHPVRAVNEVTKTAPVSTPVSVSAEPGHSLSHVYNQNTSFRHDWILALTVDIHSCSHHTASNMKPTVDSDAAIHVCPSWYVWLFTTLCIRETVVTQKCWWRRVASS